MSFQELGLSQELLAAINDQGYSVPTPVQQKAIPAIIEGRDIIAAAQTGTGKTAGFTLPLLQRLQTKPTEKRRVRALILTPTRELAAQVHESVQTYGKHLPFKAIAVFGGVSINPQISKLRKGTEIVIATPGRLLDLVGQRAIDLSSVETLVLDEADRMLDMGFVHDIKRVLKLLPKQRQNLLFSATFSNEIKTLASGLLNNPESIEVAPRNATAERVSQMIHPVDRVRKRELLSFLIGSQNWRQVLVFTRTKHGANRLATQLETDGLTSAAIHGNKSQGARTRALADFKKGKVRVLIATDIAARGLDIDKLPHVVNFDLPNVAEDYVHRIGRTGRAENEGLATSLVCIDEKDLLRDIEKLLKCKLPQEVLAGYEPDPSIPAEPIKRGGGNRPARSKSPRRNKPASNRSRSEKPKSGKPRSGKPGESRSSSGKAGSGKPRSGKPGESRSSSGKAGSGKPRSGKP
ncbi:MAG: DEAD/DEAH box helicase, partial [Coxiellaceae bacterium]|nr:DEAD/DEAH box helicase [Coxiellaceae bacterium]